MGFAPAGGGAAARDGDGPRDVRAVPRQRQRGGKGRLPAARGDGVVSMQVVAVDIGGTHARFAIAEVAGGRVVSLGEATTLTTAEHASLQTAWEAFGAR